MLFLEFNGLPGCGKSTVCEALLAELRSSGCNCAYYGEVYEKAPRKPLKAVAYALKRWRFDELQRLIKLSGSLDGTTAKTQLSRALVAEQICVNYRKLKELPGICVIDQGLVQAIASIAYTYQIKDPARFTALTEALLAPYRSDLLAVHAVLSAETAGSRIRLRNFDHGSRMNAIADDDELLLQLNRQQENLCTVRNATEQAAVSCICLDMNLPARDNALKLFRRINEDASK